MHAFCGCHLAAFYRFPTHVIIQENTRAKNYQMPALRAIDQEDSTTDRKRFRHRLNVQQVR